MKETYELLNGHKVVAFNNYYQAKNYAEKHNLKLAEYGDCYGSGISYAYWNKSGNRNDDEDVIAYYIFVPTDKHTQVPATLSKKQFLHKLYGYYL